MNTNIVLLCVGLAIGGIVALAGGLVEYLLHLRRGNAARLGVPGCLVYVAGGLILAGIVALVTSYVVTGGIGPAILVGAGVMCGFYGGFMALVLLWFLFGEQRPDPNEETLSSDQTLP